MWKFEDNICVYIYIYICMYVFKTNFVHTRWISKVAKAYARDEQRFSKSKGMVDPNVEDDKSCI